MLFRSDFKLKLAQLREARDEQINENLAVDVLRYGSGIAMKYGRQAYRTTKDVAKDVASKMLGKGKPKPKQIEAPAAKTPDIPEAPTSAPKTPKTPKAPKPKGKGKGKGSSAYIDPSALVDALKKKDSQNPVDAAITPHKADLITPKREPHMTSTYTMNKDTDQIGRAHV